MTNEELKSMIRDRVSDETILDRIVILEGDEFADGAIGLTGDYRLVYSYEKLVKALVQTDQDDDSPETKEERAAEFLDYNTLRMFPYWENQGLLLAPVIVHEF